MALKLNDRVKETSTTTGTGTLDLSGAVTAFETFVAGIGNGNTTYYAIVNRDEDEWEVGLGTVTDASTDTLARTTVISSSNSDSAVDFSAGTKDVFCTLPASKIASLDTNNNLTIGAGSAGVDYTLTFDGADSDGVLTWMEDEDLFKFSDAINVGVDDAGHDVKFFGDTASAYMLWDTSADDLVLAGAAGITVGSGAITSSGVITGTTIEATGDTSSGDNAAIGYTSAEGLILTGQGSTSDVTIKNDADGTVLTIPTGTQDIKLARHILSDSGITIDVANDITLDADGAQVWLSDGGNIYGSLSSASQGTNTDSGNLYISSYGTDKDILIGGNDGGSYVTALTLDMSEAGTAIFHENIESTGAGEHNITLSSASSSSPTISLTNTNTDNNGAILKFSRDDGDAGAASDISGVISFYSDDAAQNNQEFARISGIVLDATSGGEEGGLDFYVADRKSVV